LFDQWFGWRRGWPGGLRWPRHRLDWLRRRFDFQIVEYGQNAYTY
jgi:hypothetical protein